MVRENEIFWIGFIRKEIGSANASRAADLLDMKCARAVLQLRKNRIKIGGCSVPQEGQNDLTLRAGSLLSEQSLFAFAAAQRNAQASSADPLVRTRHDFPDGLRRRGNSINSAGL
jgi:hypothetical protein